MIEVRLSEQIGCRDGPEAVFAVDQIALGDGAAYCLVDEGLGKSEAIRGGHLHFAEELETEAEVPGYIEFLGFEGFLDGCTGGQECEARSGKDVGAQEAADYGKSEFVLDVDAVVISIGTSPNPLIKATTKGLETQKWGGIITDEHGLTSREGVYAGGDAVTGAATVILAMGAGKTAAAAIDEYIKSKE